ncbi:hypothetical protein B0H13DRAFT_2492540 [Mycena leptocephala]|nr:hypothetical protein B0H13DRAFT_2492540 [Mycena leptocephala]
MASALAKTVVLGASYGGARAAQIIAAELPEGSYRLEFPLQSKQTCTSSRGSRSSQGTNVKLVRLSLQILTGLPFFSQTGYRESYPTPAFHFPFLHPFSLSLPSTVSASIVSSSVDNSPPTSQLCIPRSASRSSTRARGCCRGSMVGVREEMGKEKRVGVGMGRSFLVYSSPCFSRPSNPNDTDMISAVLQALHALNVHVVLGERVDLSPLGLAPSSDSCSDTIATAEQRTLRTTAGRVIGLILVLLTDEDRNPLLAAEDRLVREKREKHTASGQTPPNTSLLRALDLRVAAFRSCAPARSGESGKEERRRSPRARRLSQLLADEDRRVRVGGKRGRRQLPQREAESAWNEGAARAQEECTALLPGRALALDLDPRAAAVRSCSRPRIGTGGWTEHWGGEGIRQHRPPRPAPPPDAPRSRSTYALSSSTARASWGKDRRVRVRGTSAGWCGCGERGRTTPPTPLDALDAHAIDCASGERGAVSAGTGKEREEQHGRWKREEEEVCTTTAVLAAQLDPRRRQLVTDEGRRVRCGERGRTTFSFPGGLARVPCVVATLTTPFAALDPCILSLLGTGLRGVAGWREWGCSSPFPFLPHAAFHRPPIYLSSLNVEGGGDTDFRSCSRTGGWMERRGVHWGCMGTAADGGRRRGCGCGDSDEGGNAEPSPAPAPWLAGEARAFEETPVLTPETDEAHTTPYRHKEQTTPYPHIFAIGDAADAFGAFPAGHNAWAQGEVAGRNGEKRDEGGEGGEGGEGCEGKEGYEGEKRDGEGKAEDEEEEKDDDEELETYTLGPPAIKEFFLPYSFFLLSLSFPVLCLIDLPHPPSSPLLFLLFLPHFLFPLLYESLMPLL